MNQRKLFHDQISMKECTGRGDRTRGRLHAKRTRFRLRYHEVLMNIHEYAGQCPGFAWVPILSINFENRLRYD